MAETKQKQRRYWYAIHWFTCPICAYTMTDRVRVYTKREAVREVHDTLPCNEHFL